MPIPKDTFNNLPYPQFKLQDESADIVQPIADAIGESPRLPHHIDDLMMLYEIAAGRHGGNLTEGFYLQLGTHYGGTALAIAMGLVESASSYTPLITIDPYTWAEHESAALESLEYFKKFQLQHMICPVLYTDLEYIDKFWTQPISFIFIDSVHYANHLVKELAAIKPFLIDGAWIIMHDYQNHEYVEEAFTKVIDQFIAEENVFNISITDEYMIAMQWKQSFVENNNKEKPKRKVWW